MTRFHNPTLIISFQLLIVVAEIPVLDVVELLDLSL